MEFGEYNFENFTLINPAVSSDDSYITALHEHTHRMLSVQSIVGELLYCLKKTNKLAMISNKKDCEKITLMYNFLIKHSQKTQEGVAVLVECISILQIKGERECKKYIEDLRRFNNEYYRYLMPLKFILDIIFRTKSHDKQFSILNGLSCLAICALNSEIYKICPNIWGDNKELKKFFSKKDNAEKFLPDSRFKKSINWIKKNNPVSCDDVLKLIKKRIDDDGFQERSMDSASYELESIKNFLISFFEGSMNIEFYRQQLNDISIKKLDASKIFFQQIPSTFNEPVLNKNFYYCSNLEKFMRTISNNLAVMFLLGDLKLSRDMMFSKWGINEESIMRTRGNGYLPMWISYNNQEKKDFVVGFDLTEKKRIFGCFNALDVENAIEDAENHGDIGFVLLVSYKYYDYERNCIINHSNINRDIYVYCDRTYENAQEYLDYWTEKKLYRRFMQFDDMIVLLIRLSARCIFILPMTGAVGNDAIVDIRQNRKNLIPAEKDEISKYDDFILKGENDVLKINVIINSLFYI